jgi:hypothetical protein
MAEEVPMSERDRQHGTEGGRPQTEAERMRARDEPGRNFEQEVSDSDINTDPDAGFDFDRTPSDDTDARRSER